MSFYPPKISERFLNPKNAGEVVGSGGNGTTASFVCGAALQISLRVENGKILNAKFKAAGCGFLFAAADALCEKIIGEPVNQEFNVFKIIADELGEFESSREHCVELVWQTWQKTVNDFRMVNATRSDGDEVLICTCFGVSEKTIENAIENNLLTRVNNVTQICRAGGGCGSCQPLIQEIIDDFWRDAI